MRMPPAVPLYAMSAVAPSPSAAVLRCGFGSGRPASAAPVAWKLHAEAFAAAESFSQ
jgi:hypothetical protein